MTEKREEYTEVLATGLVGIRPWQLCLYVAGSSPRSQRALANLRACCEQHLPGQYALEVIDLHESPQLAQRDQIVALPFLVRRQPNPRQCLVGDLSNHERLLRSLTADVVC